MYLKFFNLDNYPFNLTPDTKFLYSSQQHIEALNCLSYGVEHKKGFIALIGEIGTGKTTICREFLNKYANKIALSLILNPLISTKELLSAINSDFGCITLGDASVQNYIDLLNKFLLEQAAQNKNAAVIIDEAQNLSFEALEMIRMLSNLETENEKLLQIILVGQPELEDKLKSYELRQLNQRISVRYQLTPLNYNETKEYIHHRLNIANGNGNLYFENKAIKKVYNYSNGIPRLINVVCDRSLLAAYVSGTRVIGKKAVKSAILDLSGKAYKNRFNIFNLFRKNA